MVGGVLLSSSSDPPLIYPDVVIGGISLLLLPPLWNYQCAWPKHRFPTMPLIPEPIHQRILPMTHAPRAAIQVSPNRAGRFFAPYQRGEAQVHSHGVPHDEIVQVSPIRAGGFFAPYQRGEAQVQVGRIPLGRIQVEGFPHASNDSPMVDSRDYDGMVTVTGRRGSAP